MKRRETFIQNTISFKSLPASHCWLQEHVPHTALLVGWMEGFMVIFGRVNCFQVSTPGEQGSFTCSELSDGEL